MRYSAITFRPHATRTLSVHPPHLPDRYSAENPTISVELLVVVLSSAGLVVAALCAIAVATGLYVRAKRAAEAHWLNESSVVAKVKGFAATFFTPE